MKKFISRQAGRILGTLSGFDRLRFRGTFRQLAHSEGMSSILGHLHILLKDFKAFADEATSRMCASVEEVAQQAGRPVRYLPSSQIDKEALVQKTLQEQGIGKHGVVAVFSAVEVCKSYEIRRLRETRQIALAPATRKCLHYYVYRQDSMFGLASIRLQSWLPFNTHIVLNGREWLARQMDAKRLRYRRADNCFPWIASFDRAQKLADQQLRIDWPKHLSRLLYQANPALRELWPAVKLEPYWSAEQSEWATDLAFAAASDLAALHPRLVQHAITSFQSPDVMRFLGRKTPLHGGVNGHYQGEIVSDIKRRVEGVRVKHRLGGNSIKMYDKQGSVLRVETTINDTRDIKVVRPPAGQPTAKPRRQRMRKGVADLARRARFCQAANKRYLTALAAADMNLPLKRFTDLLSRAAEMNGRRFRALNPLGGDASLLAAIARGEWQLQGFRNVDIRQALFGADPTDAVDRRRRSLQVSRLLCLLRAHGLIRKVPRSQRYHLTALAEQCLPALLAVRDSSLKKLTAA